MVNASQNWASISGLLLMAVRGYALLFYIL